MVGPVAGGEIRLGMVTALSGPVASLGQDFKLGVEAYFAHINRDGGINGQPLRLLVRDDGYEPARSAPLVHQLVDQEQVLALVGNVGTPTAAITVPIANESHTLLFAAYSGADLLRREPPDRYVINYRASYAQETAAMVHGLLAAGIQPEEIAFFTQDDSYGNAGYQGAVKALENEGYADVRALSHGRYRRNTLNVEGAVASLLDAQVKPKAIIMVATYGAAARFIRLARRDLPDALYLNVSFVGSAALARELGKEGEGVIVTQVVPHFLADLPATRGYLADLAAQAPTAEPGFISLEGHLVARLLVEGLRRAGSVLTRESLVNGLEGLGTVDLGLGYPLVLDKTHHQASERIWATQLRNGVFIPLEWENLLSSEK